jgi:hypothetical protein
MVMFSEACSGRFDALRIAYDPSLPSAANFVVMPQHRSNDEVMCGPPQPE